MELISIGLLLIRKLHTFCVGASSPCDVNHFLVSMEFRDIYIYIYYIPPQLTVHFLMMRSVRYQPIFNGLKFMKFTLHRASG